MTESRKNEKAKKPETVKVQDLEPEQNPKGGFGIGKLVKPLVKASLPTVL